MASKLYRQIKTILTAHGCQFVRQGKGSHEIWHSPITDVNFSVPVTLKANPTANAILKQAGIKQRV